MSCSCCLYELFCSNGSDRTTIDNNIKKDVKNKFLKKCSILDDKYRLNGPIVIRKFFDRKIDNINDCILWNGQCKYRNNEVNALSFKYKEKKYNARNISLLLFLDSSNDDGDSIQKAGMKKRKKVSPRKKCKNCICVNPIHLEYINNDIEDSRPKKKKRNYT